MKTKAVLSMILIIVLSFVSLSFAQERVKTKPVPQQSPTEKGIIEKSGSPKPQPAAFEECYSFNLGSTVVVKKGESWVIVDSTQPNIIIASFPGNQKADAERALGVMKKYGMNQICFAKPGVAFQYELASGQAPSGVYAGEVCREFNPGAVSVSNIQGQWKIVEGTNVVYDFGSNEAQARLVLGIIKKYGFTRSCFVGRPVVGFQYMTKQVETVAKKPQELITQIATPKAQEVTPGKVAVISPKKTEIAKGTVLTRNLPDLKIEFNTTPIPQYNRETVLSVVIKNVGTKSVEEPFVTELYVDEKLSKMWSFPSEAEKQDLKGKAPKLDPGKSRLYEYAVKFPEGESHSFRWVVDAKDQIAESDESKASNVLEVTLKWPFQSDLPDLIVEDIYSDKPLVMGEEAVVKVRVKNIGKMDAKSPSPNSPIITSLKAGDLQVQIGAWQLDSLKAGESKTFETKPFAVGKDPEKFTAIVDMGNIIPEGNKNNNKLAKQITPSYVDLAVSDLSILPNNPVVNERFTISFKIGNIGTGDAVKPFKVWIFPGEVNKKGGTEPVLLPVPSLKAGNSVSLQHKVVLQNPGEYQAGIQADYPDNVYGKSEIDRSNNVMTLKLTVYKAGAITGTYPNFSTAKYNCELKPTSGYRNVLVILWDPKRPEHPAPPKSQIEQLLFGSGQNVYDWFSENSGGKLVVQNAGVLGWYNSDKQPGQWYWDFHAIEGQPIQVDEDGFIEGHVRKWWEAIRDASKEFNFAQYDKNKDGILTPDELTIFVAIPQNEPPFGTESVLAGNQWRYILDRGGHIPSGGKAISSFPNIIYHGEKIKGDPLIIQGIKIPFISEWYIGNPPDFGVAVHELCHILLDAADMYFYTPWPFGAKRYSMMDNVGSNHLDPFHKLKLGWLSYKPVNANIADSRGIYNLKNVEKGGEVLILYDSTRGSDEYFIIENRWRGTSYDNGARGWGGIPTDGVAIWHIIENPKTFNKITVPAFPNEWGRRGIRLIRADGGVNPLNDNTALFNRNSGNITSSRFPNFRWADGNESPFELEILTVAGPEVRIRISFRP